MTHVIEPATSGRAKCRGCGKTIVKGELRFGERAPNPFGDGEATYWFHLVCSAYRRPEQLLSVGCTAVSASIRLIAEAGLRHHRLPRIARVERAASGRAKCRQCGQTIATKSWRVVLQLWEEGRFSSIGFIHVACSEDYFGTADILPRIEHFTADLSAEDIDELTQCLAGS